MITCQDCIVCVVCTHIHMKLHSLPTCLTIFGYMFTFTYMCPSTWPFLKDDVSTCLGKPPRFDFATKKGGNETDAKLADPIAGAESGSCQLSESSMVIYELNIKM